MAERLGEVARDDEALLDPDAVARRYRLERARRRARVEHRRRRKRAGRRFWVVFVALLAGGVTVGVLTWREIQSLFGI